MTKEEIDELKQLRATLDRMIADAESKLAYQSSVGKKFQERLKDLERKNRLSIEDVL